MNKTLGEYNEKYRHSHMYTVRNYSELKQRERWRPGYNE